jgi:hypothetical protein
LGGVSANKFIKVKIKSELFFRFINYQMGAVGFASLSGLMYHYGIKHANKTPLHNIRCFYVLYVYRVKAYFVQGFPPIKALAENCQPTVRWVGLTEKYQSGIKFLFKIKL